MLETANHGQLGWLVQTVELPPSIKQSRVVEALVALTVRHEALRARIAQAEPEVAQTTDADAEARVHEVLTVVSEDVADTRDLAERMTRELLLDISRFSFAIRPDRRLQTLSPPGWFDRIELDRVLRRLSHDSRYTCDISAISNMKTISPANLERPSQRTPYELRQLADLTPPLDHCRSRNTHLHFFAHIGPDRIVLHAYSSDALSAVRPPMAVAQDLRRCVETVLDERDVPLSMLPVDPLI